MCVTADCDVLQARADIAADQLQVDNAVVSGMLDQIQNLSSVVTGLAPELAPLASTIANELTQLSAMYQNPSIDGGAYATAAQAWAQGPGVQEINQQLGLSATASNGLAAGLAGNEQALLTEAQALIQNAVSDAQRLADAQAALAACQAATSQ